MGVLTKVKHLHFQNLLCTLQFYNYYIQMRLICTPFKKKKEVLKLHTSSNFGKDVCIF
jgi:hypothetical protein